MSIIKPQEINLDFTQNSYKDIVVKQNDINSRTIIITCTDNGIECPLDGKTQACNIKMETPDGRPIFNSATILSDGKVQITFTEPMSLVNGKADMELQIVDQPSQEILHTMTLNVIVLSNVYPNDEIIASPEFDALNKALLAVEDCTELVNSVNVIEANEALRVENEAKREAEFAEMKEAVDAVEGHYDTIASTTVLGHVMVDGETITIDENGVISSIGGGGSSDETVSGFNDIYAETSINLGRKADTTIGEYSGVIGTENTVTAKNSIAFGYGNTVDTVSSVALGEFNQITHSTGYTFDEYGGSLASGDLNKIYCNGYNTAFGYNNTINYWVDDIYNQNICSISCFVAGTNNTVAGYTNIALGDSNESIGQEGSVAIGRRNKSSGLSSIATGTSCETSGDYSLSGGWNSVSSGLGALAFGYKCEATNQCSVALGGWNKAYASNSFVAGYNSEVGENAYTGIAMGYDAKTTATEGVAIGSYNESNGYQSLVLGAHSTVSANESIAIGYYTKAASNKQIVMGKYNEEDTEGKYAYIFGGGTYDEPKNIYTLDWDGNALFSGNVTDGTNATINGIETTTSSVITSAFGGEVTLNSISGDYEQYTTEGYSLYDFYDTTVTQNGVTVTVVDGVCTATGTPTVTEGDVCDIAFGELDLTKLENGKFINCEYNTAVYAYDASGNSLYPSGASSPTFDSSTMVKIIPHIRINSNRYEDGMSFIPMISLKSSVPNELYTGDIPSPNPSYPQSISFPIFNVLKFENELGNSEVIFDESIVLYRVNDIQDTVTSSKITKNLARATLIGSEEIGGDATLGYFIFSPSIAAKAGSINVLSDHYRNVNGDLSETDYNIFIDADGNIRIQHSGFSSIDEYKTWLISNNVEIVYERAETEVIELSSAVSDALESLKIHSGETTIYTNSTTIQPIIEIEYPTSQVGKYVVALRNNPTTGGVSIPTKVSELENDAGYITEDALSNLELDNIVPNTRTIAGIDLKDDITAEELKDVLDIYDNMVMAGELKPYLHSSEEVKVGVFRGKPLYEKIIDFGTLPNATSQIIEHGIENVETIWIHDGYCLNSNNGLSIPIVGTTPSSVEANFYFAVSPTIINCETGTDRTHYTAYLVVRYTKTTDEEGSGNDLNPYGIYDAKLDDIKADVEELQNAIQTGASVATGTLKPWLYDSEYEIIVGVYEGKPLYRKLVVLQTPTTEFAYTEVEHGIVDADRIWIDFNHSYTFTPTGDKIPLNATRPADATQIHGGMSTWVVPRITTVAMAVGGSMVNKEIYIVFEYTKTTDAEGSGNNLMPYGVSSKSTINYSTDEQCIGTWIDGKPLYQRTFVFENVTISENSLFLSTDLTNVDTIFMFNGQVKHPSGNIMPLPYCHSNADNNIGLFISGDGSGFNFRLGNENLSLVFPKIWGTVQYTKTTDTV